MVVSCLKLDLPPVFQELGFRSFTPALTLPNDLLLEFPFSVEALPMWFAMGGLGSKIGWEFGYFFVHTIRNFKPKNSSASWFSLHYPVRHVERSLTHKVSPEHLR